jgi:hypothetical protein
LRISGWSISFAPNALRWRACHTASATPRRIPAAEPITQSSRVCVTISMIVATPRPSAPSMRAAAPRNSTSDDGSERVPSLSFKRWNSMPGPRSTRKHERESGPRPPAWASTRNSSHGG